MQKPSSAPKARFTDQIPPAHEMALIHQVCAAEDAARAVLAPYNKEVTQADLEAVRYDLATALLIQLSRGSATRMDIVHSLQTKIADVQARLKEVAALGSFSAPASTTVSEATAVEQEANA